MIEPPPLPSKVVEQQKENLRQRDKDTKNPTSQEPLDKSRDKDTKKPTFQELLARGREKYGRISTEEIIKMRKEDPEQKAEREAFFNDLKEKADAVLQHTTEALEQAQDTNEKKEEEAILKKRIKNATSEEFKQMLKERHENRNQNHITFSNWFAPRQKELYSGNGGRKKKTRSKKNKKKSRLSRKR